MVEVYFLVESIEDDHSLRIQIVVLSFLDLQTSLEVHEPLSGPECGSPVDQSEPRL